jgi:hypothetical protein
VESLGIFEFIKIKRIIIFNKEMFYINNIECHWFLLLAKLCRRKGYHIGTQITQKTFRIILQEYYSREEIAELEEILQEY